MALFMETVKNNIKQHKSIDIGKRFNKKFCFFISTKIIAKTYSIVKGIPLSNRNNKLPLSENSTSDDI